MASTGLRMCKAIFNRPVSAKLSRVALGTKMGSGGHILVSKAPRLKLQTEEWLWPEWKIRFFHWLKPTECAHQLKSTTLAVHNISDVDLSNCKHEIRVSDLSLVLMMHLRHGRWYCLGYCSDMRTEVARNIGHPSLYRRHACGVDSSSTSQASRR